MMNNIIEENGDLRIDFESGAVVMIAAVDDAMGLGRRGAIPWNVPSDRAFFRRQTMGAAVIVGRVTYESLPVWRDGRRGLDGRLCAVLSRRSVAAPVAGVVWGSDAGELLERCRAARGVVYVAGGGMVYRALLPQATDVLLSRIAGDWQCDVQFVAVGAPEWQLVAAWPMPGFVLQWWRKSAHGGV